MQPRRHTKAGEGARRNAANEFTLVEARGAEFEVMALVPIIWPDGSEMVPAGAVGQVVRGLSFGGERPGHWVDWGHYGKCTIPANVEGMGWVRVQGARLAAVMVS